MLSDPRVLASYRLTFGTSLIGAAINAVFGFVVAWTLVRYHIPGKRMLDALIDLPFAMPTAVSGIALTAIYAPTGWIGSAFAQWESNCIFAIGNRHCIDVYRASVRGANVAAGIDGIGRRSRRGQLKLGATVGKLFAE